MDVVYVETVVFFYDFHGLGGIRSTQPTVLRNGHRTVPRISASPPNPPYQGGIKISIP